MDAAPREGMGTVLIGLLPSYAAAGALAPVCLVALRFAQGLAVGGQWGGATLVATESAPPDRRGFFGSFAQAGVFASPRTYPAYVRFSNGAGRRQHDGQPDVHSQPAIASRVAGSARNSTRWAVARRLAQSSPAATARMAGYQSVITFDSGMQMLQAAAAPEPCCQWDAE